MNGQKVAGNLTNHSIFVGEVWFANFPLEEDPTNYLPRPVIILNVDEQDVLVIKITKTSPRPDDRFDTPIVNWQFTNLRMQFTARVSKTQFIKKNQIKHKIGNLHPNDLFLLQNKYIEYINSQD